MAAAATSSSSSSSSFKSKVPKTMAATYSYLPDELWERIIKLFSNDTSTLKSLSVVSKLLLSITNHLRFSVTISNKTIHFLSRILQRFPNLTSLHITPSLFLLRHLFKVNDLDALLTKISTFPLFAITSLYLSNCNRNIPANGLRALSKKMTNLKSFTCSKMYRIAKNDLFLIADCFPLLEELNLSYPTVSRVEDFVLDHDDQLLVLPKLRKINLTGNFYIKVQFIDYLRKNCHLLQEVITTDDIFWRFCV